MRTSLQGLWPFSCDAMSWGGESYVLALRILARHVDVEAMVYTLTQPQRLNVVNGTFTLSTRCQVYFLNFFDDLYDVDLTQSDMHALDVMMVVIPLGYALRVVYYGECW